MVHSDPQMTDNINIPLPKGQLEPIWCRNELIGEKAGSKGNGVVSNGKIAACTFNGSYDNLVVYDYHGNRLWSSKGMLNALAVSSSPMISIDNKIIACDNKTIFMLEIKDDDWCINWISDIPKTSSDILIPFSPTIVQQQTVILPTKNGPLFAYDADAGDLLTMKHLGLYEGENHNHFSTINSACVHDNRVYISTESSSRTDFPRGRLYAIDVNRSSVSNDEILSEAWYYPYQGISQASPLFIDNTVYFDGYTIGWKFLKNPKIYALIDMGDEYKVINETYENRTLFSFSKDPRGGFWYEDTRGKKLVHFTLEDEKLGIVEEISVNDLIPNIFGNYRPLSCMTICDQKHPIMLISVITYFMKKYIVAVDLENDNQILWRMKTDDIGINYSGGQYTILRRNNDSSQNRILYGGYWGGVIALGNKD